MKYILHIYTEKEQQEFSTEEERDSAEEYENRVNNTLCRTSEQPGEVEEDTE